MFLVAAALAAAITTPSIPPTSVADARETLDTALPDYPSTRLKDVRAMRFSDGSIEFCGMINPKNRLGGYEGWQTFVVMTKLKLLIPQSTCLGGDLLPGDVTALLAPKSSPSVDR